MAMTPKSDTRVTDQICEYMVIQISYDKKLILPIEQGNKFLEIYSQAQSLVEDYKKPNKIDPCPPQIQVSYLTRQKMADIKMNAILNIEEGAED